MAMSDFGLQNAVLGMLSLSQQSQAANLGSIAQQPVSTNPTMFTTSSTFNPYPTTSNTNMSLFNTITSSYQPNAGTINGFNQLPQDQTVPNGQSVRNTHGALPLTPPGSPDDEDPKLQAVSQQLQPSGTVQSALLACLQSSNGVDMSVKKDDANTTAVLSTGGLAELPSTANAWAPSGNVATAPGGYGLGPIAFSGTMGGIVSGSSGMRRPRSEKKAIPPEQKDERYYERRSRNNEAAKKSRDHRKRREDEVALRAAYLERDNAVLRAQLATLREEAQSLRNLMLQKQQQRQLQMQVQPTM